MGADFKTALRCFGWGVTCLTNARQTQTKLQCSDPKQRHISVFCLTSADARCMASLNLHHQTIFFIVFYNIIEFKKHFQPQHISLSTFWKLQRLWMHRQLQHRRNTDRSEEEEEEGLKTTAGSVWLSKVKQTTDQNTPHPRQYSNVLLSHQRL